MPAKKRIQQGKHMRIFSLIPALFLSIFIFGGCTKTDKDSSVPYTPWHDKDGDGYTKDDGDCNDDDATINPDAEEICDGLDNDCDNGIDEDAVDTVMWWFDKDGDGYGNEGNDWASCDQPAGYVLNSTDCNDDDATINPDAKEICDGLDNDCDGQIDNVTASSDGANPYYRDNDLDGYGVGGAVYYRCSLETGYSETFNDCNDDDDAINPDAEEICDGLDNDCDGDTDEDLLITWYADADEDIYGDAANTVIACDAPVGYSIIDGDCDDMDATINPSALELCNGIDDNCSGSIDEDGVIGGFYWYANVDGDSYGDVNNSTFSCTQPTGYLADASDCDDSDVAVYPGAPEFCNGIDDNCDGQVDEESAVDAAVWYADTDLDGFGDVGDTTHSCTQPTGYVTDASDCDDSDVAVYPGAPEFCNGIDDNCDGQVDEESAVDAAVWYANVDGDSYGDMNNSTFSCTQPTGYLADASDCDDSDVAVYPGAPEFCNGIDDNCDGQVDEESAVDAAVWYADTDLDGFGDAGNSVTSCVPPVSYTSDATDCDDSNDLIYPEAEEIDCDDPNDYNCDGSAGYSDNDRDGYSGCEECDDSNDQINPTALEICDEQDNDCDGEIDGAGAFDATTWHVDSDGDNYGNGLPLRACSMPEGYVALGGDCDDSDANQYPGAPEVCNGEDDDCDAPFVVIDEGATDVSVYYVDADRDGYGDAGNSSTMCTPLAGYVTDASDCDDSDVAVYPGAPEFCNGVDHDCDGQVDEESAVDAAVWYADTDLDGFGDVGDTTHSCTQPAGYVTDASDCDDSRSSVNPDADEVCDGRDNDCDSITDTDAIDAVTWYRDYDGDGYGDPTVAWATCYIPSNYVENDADCDDLVGTINPIGSEHPYDGIDQDCDGLADDDDLDEDGYGIITDCNDFNAAESPGEGEQCNGIDDDCDHLIDEDWAPGDLCTYDDNDGDGYGASNEDCNDFDVNIHPGATEVCADGIDNNCSGVADYLDGLEVCY